MATISDDDKKQIYDDFKDKVNLTASQMKKWLDSDEAKSVGIKKGTTTDKKTDTSGGESVGHDSGRKIVGILEKKKGDLTDHDYEHMKKVNAYIARHSKQKPSGDAKDSRWRHSLMNWGNDPLK